MVNDIHKAGEDEEEINFEKEVEAASTGHLVDRIKQIGRSDPLK